MLQFWNLKLNRVVCIILRTSKRNITIVILIYFEHISIKFLWNTLLMNAMTWQKGNEKIQFVLWNGWFSVVLHSCIMGQAVASGSAQHRPWNFQNVITACFQNNMLRPCTPKCVILSGCFICCHGLCTWQIHFPQQTITYVHTVYKFWILTALQLSSDVWIGLGWM